MALVTMSRKEIERLGVIRQVLEGRLRQAKAGQLMGLSARQVRRLCAAYEREGPNGLASRKRGRPSNRRLPEVLQARTTEIVRDLYGDFGPTLAQEKLLEVHGLRVGKETLRKWMAAAGIWVTRDKRLPKVHQPRCRRACLGELVQIDGSPHAWFEERGPACTLLVYVRRHGPADGTALRAIRIDVRLLCFDGDLPPSPRKAGGILQRQTQHFPNGASRSHWARRRRDTVRPRAD